MAHVPGQDDRHSEPTAPLELAVEATPSGAAAAPLVVAHGLFGSKRNWAGLARRFADAAPVLAVDLRNHGESPWDDAMDYLAMGRDLLSLIRARANGRAQVLGHSMGGKAAMAAALQAPEAIGALVVVDIAPVGYAHAEHGEIVRAMAAADLTHVTRRSEVETALATAAPDPSLRAFLLQNLAFETVEGAKRARWKPNLKAIETSLDALTRWPSTLAPGAGTGTEPFTGPTLVVKGAASPYVDDAGMAAFKALFPNAEYATLSTGHWPHAEAPTAFFDTVSRWLAAHPVAQA